MNNTLARTGAAIAIALLIVFALKPGENSRQRGWWDGYESDTTERGKLNKRFALSRRAAFEYRAAEERAMARELAAAASPTATPLTMRFSPDLPPRVRTAIETTVRGELAALGLESPRHPVVVIAASDSASKAPRYRRAVVLPERADGPCAVVVHIPRRQFSYFRTSSMDRTLGTCAFHAAFGTPGAGMHEWLLETQLARAVYLTPPASVAEDTAMIKTRTYWYTTNIPLRGCRAGRQALCDVHFSGTDTLFAGLDRAYFEEFATRSTEANGLLRDVVMFDPAMPTERSRVTHGLLAELASSLGPDRFGTIWRGDGPTRGFERAEGRPLWEWTQELLLKRVLPDDIGSGLTLGSALLTLLVVGGVFVLTIKVAPRRID